jgi:hypothetical protein
MSLLCCYAMVRPRVWRTEAALDSLSKQMEYELAHGGAVIRFRGQSLVSYQPDYDPDYVDANGYRWGEVIHVFAFAPRPEDIVEVAP